MKRLMMMVAASAAMAMGAHGAPDIPKNAAQCLGCAAAGTNAFYVGGNVLNGMTDADRAQVDAAIAAMARPELASFWLSSAYLLPNASRAVAASIRGRFPALAAQYEANAERGGVGAHCDAPGVVTEHWLRSETLLGRGGIGISTIDLFVRLARTEAQKNVRRKLRAEGLAIVTKDGRDLAKDRLDAVAAALNAPRFAGVSNALAACGVTVQQPELATVPAADSAALRKAMDDVYNGDVPMAQWSARFRYALGVEAYNAFVERYNGGN